jgi:hypothetical protein
VLTFVVHSEKGQLVVMAQASNQRGEEDKAAVESAVERVPRVVPGRTTLLVEGARPGLRAGVCKGALVAPVF